MAKKYGILAYPAGHSLSPVMHNAAFKALGIDAQYGVFEIDLNGFDGFMETVIHEPISGLSVSLPYKEHVTQFLNEIDEDARKIGAVNTVLNYGGFLKGFNTDFLGSNRALEEVCGSLEDKEVVVVGAGGAARALIYGLLKRRAKVSIFNRHSSKAADLAKEFGDLFGTEIISGPLKDLNKLKKADILVQATSIWTLKPQITPTEIEQFLSRENIDKFSIIMDIVYKPLLTPLLKTAKELGKTIITGEKMLLFQAIEQFKIWTGKEAPTEVMREVLENNLV